VSSDHADTFARFVEWVEEHLDDRTPTGAEVAADHYLSRFHFDRLIQTVGGEAPGRFKRRILLERAAYQLATSECSVLEVAVGAGYGSHEAFTRAFRRAYGSSPSDWRTAPGRAQIETPNGVHFNPPGRLLLPARPERTEMESEHLLVRMIQHHTWLIGEMVERVSHLDPAVLDTPIEISVEGIDDEPTLRSLLSRLVGQLEMWNRTIAGEPYDFAVEADEAVTSMRARLRTAGPAFTETVRQVVDHGRLDETFIDALCDPPEVFSYSGVIAHVLTFAAHRRTLVLGALASAGVTDLGSGDPARWVAEVA
jgi:AraC-like DNA-binding protein